jgi:hypothetical protein
MLPIILQENKVLGSDVLVKQDGMGTFLALDVLSEVPCDVF